MAWQLRCVSPAAAGVFVHSGCNNRHHLRASSTERSRIWCCPMKVGPCSTSAATPSACPAAASACSAQSARTHTSLCTSCGAAARWTRHLASLQQSAGKLAVWMSADQPAGPAMPMASCYVSRHRKQAAYAACAQTGQLRHGCATALMWLQHWPAGSSIAAVDPDRALGQRGDGLMNKHL
jgi:hypothetical protein